MEEYIDKNFTAAQEYLESGIHFSNLQYVLQAKQMLVNLYPFIATESSNKNDSDSSDSSDNDSDNKNGNSDNENKGESENKGGHSKKLLIEKLVRAFTALCVLDPNNSLEYLNKALEYDDKNPIIFNNLGFIYHNKMNDYDKAIQFYNKCFQYDKRYLTGYHGIIDIYRSLRHHALELEYAKKGLDNCPEAPSMFNLYGLALLNNSKFSNMQRIIDIFNQGLMLCKTRDDLADKCKILVNLGHVHGITGDYYKGIEYYIDALEADPTHANAYQNILLNLHYFNNDDANHNFIFGRLLEIFKVNKYKTKVNDASHLILKLHHQICKNLYPQKEITRTFEPRDVTKKINIGYVSSDLFDHAVSFFAKALFTHYNKDAFNVYVYSNNIYDIGTINTLPCTNYICIKGIPAQQAAGMILKDKIDILIDLSGQTSGNRLDIFNLKPAPVLLTYLGYPNDIGLPYIRRISDEYTEKYKPKECTSYTLPRLFLSYTPTDKYTYEAKSRLQGKSITFGCFAKLQKINTSCIIVWKHILEKLPNAKLVLKSKYFADPKVMNTWKQKFKPHEKQVVLLKGTKTSGQHMDMFHLIDIHLDTWPYSGTTISTESLYMNVPVLTYCAIPTGGHSSVGHVERVTGSILQSMGLEEECVANSKSQYVSKAVKLAKFIKQGNNLEVRKKFLESDISNHSKFILEYEKLLSDIYIDNVPR